MPLPPKKPMGFDAMLGSSLVDPESAQQSDESAQAPQADPLDADPVLTQENKPSASLAGSVNKMNAKPKLDAATQKALKELMLQKMLKEKENSVSLQDSIKQLNLRFFGNQNASFPKK